GAGSGAEGIPLPEDEGAPAHVGKLSPALQCRTAAVIAPGHEAMHHYAPLSPADERLKTGREQFAGHSCQLGAIDRLPCKQRVTSFEVVFSHGSGLPGRRW